MLEFIAARLGFWAVVVLLSFMGVGLTIGSQFTKLEDKLPKVLVRFILRLFITTGILGWILFLVALAITAWPS